METACQKRRPCIEAGKDVKRKKKRYYSEGCLVEKIRGLRKMGQKRQIWHIDSLSALR